MWVCSGLVDSQPILSGLDVHDEELNKLGDGLQVLIVGMVGWLSVVTVAAICIFVGVYIRMSRVARSLDDAETGSSISSRSSRLVEILCGLLLTTQCAWFGLVVASLGASAQLLNVEPGW